MNVLWKIKIITKDLKKDEIETLIFAGEELIEAPLLKIRAFVTHVHPLHNKDFAPAIHPQIHIAQLRPGENHQTQIRTGQSQNCAHLTGAKALRGNRRIVPKGKKITQK